MTIDEYVAQAKEELDDFMKDYKEGTQIDPDNWPVELDEGEWGEQEIAARFE